MRREDILERKEAIIKWIEEGQSKAYICRELQCKPETLNSYLIKMDIVYKGNQGGKGYKNSNTYKTAEEYIQNTHVKSHVLKLKLIKDGLRENKCEICGLNTWQGFSLPLELHHKDGNHFNNNLDNVQILCPNCHSIQGGNSGANVGRYAAMLEQEDNTHLECVPKQGMGSNPISSTKKLCVDCGKEISPKATRCKSCAASFRQESRAPSREELKSLIRTSPFTQIGKDFGVSDNAVRKWCKTYNLPFRTQDIKQISNEDWINI